MATSPRISPLYMPLLKHYLMLQLPLTTGSVLGDFTPVPGSSPLDCVFAPIDQSFVFRQLCSGGQHSGISPKTIQYGTAIISRPKQLPLFTD